MNKVRTAVVFTALAVLCCAWMASAVPRTAPLAPAVAQTVIPGENPRVQQWFRSRETRQIELNNALQAARDLTGPSVRATSACSRLAVVTWQLKLSERAPETKLQGPVNAGQAQFQRAAQACLAGDFATMRQQIEEGTALRAEAQHHLDEILHGEE